MPLFFFDSNDGNLDDYDTTGVELLNEDEARNLAIKSLIELMLESRHYDERHSFTTSVRDESGAVLYSMAFNLIEKWHVTGREQPGR